MFGSVTTGDVSEALAAQGFRLTSARWQLAETIKIIGDTT